MITRKYFKIASWGADCGCTIEQCSDGGLGVDYCSEHTAAPKAVEALKTLPKAVEALKAMVEETREDDQDPALMAALEMARALLREIEVQKRS